MESSEVISVDKSPVVIQLNPRVTHDRAICDEEQTAGGEIHYTAQPKALGTVQIMVGLMVFSLGIVLRISAPGYGVFEYSGITYWGSLVNIIAGSLSAVAQNKRHPCLVKVSHGMNIFSTLFAMIAIILMSMHLALVPRDPYYSFWIVVILAFTILQFIISICISVFPCKATSNSGSTVMNVALNQVNDLQKMLLLPSQGWQSVICVEVN